MAKELTKEQLQAELEVAIAKVSELTAENAELQETAEQLNAALASAETAPVSANSVKVGSKNYNVVVPQSYYGGKLTKTAEGVKADKEFAKFAIESGLIVDPKAEEGESK